MVDESDMITEIVDVSGLEEGEEDILGDIIEDVEVEEEQESTGRLGGEETVDMPTDAEATAEITEFDEEAFEQTAEITELEEESFEGEELEDILAGEEELHGEPEEEFEVPYGAPLAQEAEAPVSAWVVVLLALVFLVQIFGGLFVVENALNPEYSTKITEKINFFKEQAPQG